MNDFTKDELKDILSWADVYTVFGSSWTTKLHLPLIDKIQTMIENYCEHEKVIPNYGPNSQCANCGELW